MDGTLIDSNGIWKDVDIAFLKKRGFAYTRAYYEGVAHTIFPLAAKFTKEYCHLSESTEEIMAEWMEMAGDAYATRVPVKPGVQAYLDRCRAAGERMIVLTSSVPAHCHAALGHLGCCRILRRSSSRMISGSRRRTRRSTTSRRGSWACARASVRCSTTRSRRCAGQRAPGCAPSASPTPYFAREQDALRAVCDRYIESFEELLLPSSKGSAL